jgi:Flp pilus assembly pilin Flp
MIRHLHKLHEQAQGLIEYGLILAIMCVLGAAGLTIFGPAVSSLISTVAYKVVPNISP